MVARRSSVMNAPALKPELNRKPSVMSRLVSVERDSSIVIEPSCPTLSNAVAISFPIVESLLADIVAICSISSILVMGVDRFFRLLTTSLAARSMPR